MASQSLYRKWRSQTFGDLVGQESIVQTLKNALNTDSLAHAYLFTGPRGTGKTSMARLLAKTVNCEHVVNGEPCNKCQQCLEITAGNSFNVIEIDAASNRGIDSIRDLREKVMMPPSTGKYKVYVLDEAHMLTTEAFNALLKTLEEPPDYAIFVLATTDVHKLLPTVLSRCQRFDFKRFTTRQIVGHLKFVAGEEQVKLEPSAAELIARAAAGGMRDAVSLLDQAIAYSGNEISLAQVQAMLGVADPRAIQKLIDHVAHRDSPAGLHLIHELSEAGADLRQINIQVGEYWRALMLAKAGADVATILDRTEEETKDIMQMMPMFGLEELTEFARIFAQNDLMQKNQGTPQLGMELAFLQCIELHRRASAGQPPALSTSAPVPSVSPAQPQQASVQTPQTSRPAPTTTLPPVPQAGTNHVSPAAQPEPRTAPVNENIGEDLSAYDDVSFHDEDDEAFVAGQHPQTGESTIAVPQAGEPGQSLTLQQVHQAWESVKKRVKQKNIQTAALLDHYSVVHVEDVAEHCVVTIQAKSDIFYKHMQQRDRATYIEWALEIEFGHKCKIHLLNAGQSLPANHGSSAAHTAAIAPQQSAHRERPATKQPPPPQNAVRTEPTTYETAQRTVQDDSAFSSPSEVPLSESERPLARKNIVRENGNKVAPSSSMQQVKATPSLEELQRKASVDPVVQKVKEMFRAEIKEIRPK